MPSHEELKEYLEKLNNDISIEIRNTPPGRGFESTCFARIIQDKLINDDVFQFSDDADNKFFNLIDTFEYHSADPKKNMRMDGCLILQNANEGKDVHVFVADYERRTEVENISVQEVRDLFMQAFNFILNAGAGNFKDRIPSERVAHDVCDQIANCRDKISAIYVWVLSNRYCENECDSRTSMELWGKQTEVIRRIVDLGYLMDAEEEKPHNSIDLSCADGIDAFKVELGEDAAFECYMSSIPALFLVQAYSAHGTSLIEKNVRAYLGANKTNKGIKETIIKAPETFVALNNGLVVITEDIEMRSRKLYKMKNFQIVNGGQTTATLYYTYMEAARKKDVAEGKKIQENFKKVLVPLKIIKIVENRPDKDEKDFNFAAKISIAANSQSVIKTSDLSATVQYYQEFERISRNLQTSKGGKWFFERARGAYSAEEKKYTGQKKKKDEFNSTYPKEKMFTKTDLAIAAIAWEQRPADACKGAQGAFAIFNESVKDKIPTETDVKTLICKWMVFIQLERKLKENKFQNPRTVVIYSIYLFSKWFSSRISWDKLWERQSVPDGVMKPLYELSIEVGKLIRNNMGEQMINMYGRKEACRQAVDEISPSFEKAFEPAVCLLFNNYYG